MLCLYSPWLNGSFSYFRFLLRFNMPKYAVAIGRKVGIYDSWNDCSAQVKNFPNARYRKFDRVEEAEDFIKRFSSSNSCDNKPSTSIIPVRDENVNRPELIKLGSTSTKPGEILNLMGRLTAVEERLGKFILETTSQIEELVSRVNKLEGKRLAVDFSDAVGIPPTKKRKPDQPLGNDLKVNDEGYVIVYTDGACSKNGQMGAKAGIGVWFNSDHPLNISAPLQGPATNNNAEIQAARVAITQAHQVGVHKLSVHTDSKFLINCITQWIHKWKKNNWQLTSGGPVKNKEELVKLENAIQLLDLVEWIYVPGHRGHEGNEMADRLAREGAERYKTNVTYGNLAEDAHVKYFEEQD